MACIQHSVKSCEELNIIQHICIRECVCVYANLFAMVSKYKTKKFRILEGLNVNFIYVNFYIIALKDIFV